MAVEITVYPYLSPRVVEIDGVTYPSVSVQDLYDAIRAWEDSDVNIDDDSLIDAAGKENLGGGVTVGITATLQNTRLLFNGNTTPLDDGSGRTCDATDTAGRQLYVDDADFVTAGVVAGDVVFNTTTGEMATVTEVVDQYTLNHLPLQGYGNSGWTSGNSYQVYENIQCVISGGNLVAVDDVGADLEPILQSPLVQVVRTSSSSATLSELDAIQYSSYGGGVSLDPINGQSGTDYPVGNQEFPVDNLSDAVIIANQKGFKTIFVRESMTIDSGTTISDFTLIGRSPTLTTLTMHSSAICDGITLENANVVGTLDGGTTIRNCNVGTINYVNGEIHNSGLYGTIYLDGNEEAVIANCYTIDQDSTPVIDMGGSGQDLSMPNYSGIVTIQNLTSGTEEIGVGLNAGAVVIDSSVTAGTIVISGVGVLTDNSTGSAVVNTDGLMSKDTIATTVWDEDLSTHLSSGSAGLSLGIQQYNGAVHINTSSGNSGTTFPVGTDRAPVDNLSDALSIASSRGLNVINLDSNLTIGVSDNISGYTITSDNHSTITLTSGCTTVYTSFNSVNIVGEFGGYVTVESCSIDSSGVSEFHGIMDRCVFNGGVGVSGNTVNNAIFIDCYTGNVSGPPTIDCNGDGAKISMRGLTGAFLFTNKTGATQKVFIDLYSARVGFASSITAGEITVRGTGYIYLDDSTGTTFDTTGLISKITISEAVWDEPLTGSTHNLVNSAGRKLRQLNTTVIHEGTAQGSGVGSNQIQLDTNASSDDGAYDPAVISIVDNTGSGQTRLILEYDGATKVATVDRDWKTTPDNTSAFVISSYAGREHVNEGLAQGGSTNTITLNALASSDDGSYVGQVVFIRSGTGADQAGKVMSYNGTTKVATMCKDWYVTPDSSSAYVMLPTGFFDGSELIDKIWDELAVDHTTAGTMGKALSDAGSSGNPWATPVAGNMTPGSFGELVGKKLLKLATWLGLK